MSRPSTPQTWEPGYTVRYDEDWFKALPAGKQQRFKEQDRERIAAHWAVIDGKMTGEDFVTLCGAQFRENMADAPMSWRPPPDDEDRSIAERAGLMNPARTDDRIAEEFDDGFIDQSEFEDGYAEQD